MNQFYILLIPVFFFLVSKKMIWLPVFLGLLSGIIISERMNFPLMSAYTGLNLEKVDVLKVVLDEDSFLSSNGNRIIRASLLEVKSGQFIETTASGSVLIIDKSEESLYWGEIMTVNASINLMNDSKEFKYIAYAGDTVLRYEHKYPLFNLRKKVKRKIESKMSVFPYEISALFNALFTGNSDFLSSEFKNNFRNSGVSHLLALSGFHIAIIVLLLTSILKIVAGKSIAIIFSIPFLMIYLFLTGPSPSLLRAVIMYLVGGTFILLKKNIKINILLMISCFLQLVFSPIQGWSLSFMLSYLALAGIISIGKRVNFYLQPWIPGFLRIPISASLGAHILTAPLLIYHFRVIYPQGIFASLLVTPMIVLFMWITIIVFLVSFMYSSEVLFQISNSLCLYLFELIRRSVNWFANIEGITFSSSIDIFIYLSIVSIIVVSLYLEIWRTYGRRKSSKSQLRFTKGNKSFIGNYGIGTQKKMESEFFNK